jgi:hypothetical protein
MLGPTRMRMDVCPLGRGRESLSKRKQIGVEERLDPVGASEPSVDRLDEWLRPRVALSVQAAASEHIARPRTALLARRQPIQTFRNRSMVRRYDRG